MNNLIYVISNILMSSLTIFCYSKMTNKEFKINGFSIIVIIINSILVMLNNIYINVSLKIIISLLLSILMIKIIFKDKLKIVILYTILYTIISIVIDFMLSIILIYNIVELSQLNNTVYIKLLITLLEGICIYKIYTSKIFYSLLTKIKYLKNNSYNLYYIFVIILLILNILCVTRTINLGNNALYIVIFISIMYIIGTIKVIINDKYTNSLLTIKNEDLSNAFRAYSETIDEYRTLRHNLKNDLLILKVSLSKVEQEKLNEIINKHNKNCAWINIIDAVPEGLQGIIFLKIKEAEQYKIKVLINSNNNVKVDNKDFIDLSSIIGILFDNAIEASINAKSKIIEVDIFNSNNKLEILIMNKFRNSLDLTKIGKKNYSTKTKKSGIGLNFIKNIKNSKIKVTYKVVNDLYITKIEYK